ncbi:MAG: DUF4097 domain-containing protein [Oscillospiraceae bacterium]|nr:DUF4097 domain-containing protein [Oscillospiraceae bacterium]
MDKQIYRFPNEIDRVEIGSIGAKIIVKRHGEEAIVAEYDNPRDTPEFAATISGKTLSLKEKLSLSIFGSKPTEGYSITVYLPERCFEKLAVNTASGGAEIEGVTARDFDLNTASGEININAYFENITIQSASGNITLTNPTDKPAKSLHTCTVSGNAKVVDYKAEKFSLHSVSGRTAYSGASGAGKVAVTSGTVDVSYSEWNADLDVSAISGSVNLTLPKDSGLDISFGGISGTVKTDIGNERGSFVNLGKGTSGEFGGENKHKLNINLTSGVVTAAQA